MSCPKDRGGDESRNARAVDVGARNRLGRFWAVAQTLRPKPSPPAAWQMPHEPGTACPTEPFWIRDPQCGEKKCKTGGENQVVRVLLPLIALCATIGQIPPQIILVTSG